MNKHRRLRCERYSMLSMNTLQNLYHVIKLSTNYETNTFQNQRYSNQQSLMVRSCTKSLQLTIDISVYIEKFEQKQWSQDAILNYLTPAQAEVHSLAFQSSYAASECNFCDACKIYCFYSSSCYQSLSQVQKESQK